MGFKRVWDKSCPHVWDTWEADGKKWIVQDLLPEDDETALDILINSLGADEPLCAHNDLLNDPESVQSMAVMWRHNLSQRTSLGCYTDVDGQKTLVALNCCVVVTKDDHEHPEIKGKAWKNVFAVLEWMENQQDIFKYIGDDKFLTALGLVVKREYRGARLGGRLLNAREPLCRLLGVKGTATVFTGPASQKLAANCGFKTVLESTWTDFAEAGMDYPRRDDKVVKFKIKKYE